MLETHLSSPVTCERLRASAVAEHIDAFADWLHSAGYTAVTVAGVLRSLAGWTDWMRTAGYTAQDLLAGLDACKAMLAHEVRVPFRRGPNCLFHANWTPIPAQAGHPFHANLDSRSEATRGVDAVYAGVGSSVNLGWIFRRDSPARVRGWAWWTRRSRMASARVGSPRASCQWATGNWLVTRVERV